MKKISFTEWLTCCALFFAASIIVGFSLLKFLPLSFAWVWVIATASVGWWIWHTRQVRLVSRFSPADGLVIVLLLPLFFLFGKLYFTQLVPSGTDMATHSYIAAVIRYFNAFPKTYEPLVPIAHFGFEPIGMGTLIAAASQLFGLPVFRASLLVSLLIYPVGGFVLYTFLKSFFSRWAALLTAYAVFFVDADLTSYGGWGAHPTVLSVLFLALAVYWLVITFRRREYTVANGVVSAVWFSASLLTHPSPFLAGAYFLLLPALWAMFRFGKNLSFRRFSMALIGAGILFTASFWSSLHPISSETYRWLQNFQRHRVYIMIDITHLPSSIVSYLAKESGVEWTVLIFIGFALSIARKKEAPWFLIGFLTYALLMFNTHFWKLPFSPALYPDRTHTAALLIFCYFVAVVFDQALGFLQRLITSADHRSRWKHIFFLGVLAFLLYKPAWNLIERRYEEVFFLFQSEIFVSDDDLAVMQYLHNHSEQTDIVANNIGDAGIWIPAIAERMVTDNDAVPHSFDELEQREALLEPTYAFIDENPVYPEKSPITEQWVEDHNFQLVFQSGGSKLYKK